MLLLLSDYCVTLHSFEGEEDGKVNQVYKDYHGLLSIDKIQSLGSLGPPNQLIQETYSDCKSVLEYVPTKHFNF